ncbi:arrestin domain-containing protein 17-like [Babylonia areolata]|uniref:arrestin domain-containing protein 17-like n=1 Tax=Babylonia areolata TaxID=304850 RepID=UPI003FD48072
MGKAEAGSLQIQFGNSSRVYQAGNRVTGSVLQRVGMPMARADLQLKLCGKGSVAFSRESGGKRRNHYLDSEYYLLKNIHLWPEGGRHNHNNAEVLGVGHHEFPFSFSLPRDIPSSFHVHAGNIRYYLKAELQVDKRKSSSVKEFFVVVQPLDLNTVPDARLPAVQHEDNMVWCMCCASGSVSATVRLTKGVFVPGEGIPVHAQIINSSSITIRRTYFTIEEIAHCHAGGKTETSCRELKTKERLLHSAIPPGATDEWMGEEVVTVPVAVPTGLQGSSLIDVEHQLVLHVVPSGPTCTARMSVDIVIGSVPLRESEDGQQPSAAAAPVGEAYSMGEARPRPKQRDTVPAHGRVDRNTEFTWESGYLDTQV